jgi:chromosome segregation ATPase
MSDPAVSLELLARLFRELQADLRAFRAELAEFRDQMTVQTAILLRVEAGQNSMTEQLRAMASQHQRTDRRLLGLDERLRVVEEERP